MSTPTFKVVLLGDLGVGKTCLRSQFVHHIFTNAYKATIGGDYLTSLVSVQNNSHDTKVNLQIWDTAGQERFNLISRAFYRGTDVVILVYDVTNYESLLNLKTWFLNFIEHCHVQHPGVIVVGNKTDKASERVVDFEEVKEILTLKINSGAATDVDLNNFVDWDKDVFELCSKKLEEVNQVFYRVSEVGLDLSERPHLERRASDMVTFDLNEATELGRLRCFC